jgi:hypothetical protein
MSACHIVKCQMSRLVDITSMSASAPCVIHPQCRDMVHPATGRGPLLIAQPGNAGHVSVSGINPCRGPPGSLMLGSLKQLTET